MNLSYEEASLNPYPATLRDDPQDQIVCFFNIVQTAFDPPPLALVLNIYVADFSKVLLFVCPKHQKTKPIEGAKKMKEEIRKQRGIVVKLKEWEKDRDKASKEAHY